MHVLLYVSSLKQQQPPNFSDKKLPRRHCVGSRLSTRSVMLKCSQLLPKIGISPWWPDCAHWTHISVWLILYISSPVACQLVAPKKSPNHLTTSENVGRQPQHAPSTSRLLILVQSIITNHPIHSNFPSLHTPSPSDICKKYNCMHIYQHREIRGNRFTAKYSNYYIIPTEVFSKTNQLDTLFATVSAIRRDHTHPWIIVTIISGADR